MTTLHYILDRNKNNFDLIRLFAALAVIFGHSFALHPHDGQIEPIIQLLKFTYSGALAVDIFFFLSGILVTSSFCQTRSYTRFCLMRIARIWPGLAICLLTTITIVGPTVTTLAIKDYFTSPQTINYIWENLKITNIVFALPGVFKDNHYKEAVNGSLWTLPTEVRCYVMVFIIGALGFLKSRVKTILAGLMTASLLFLSPQFLGYFKANQDTLRMPLLFLLGIVCYINREKIIIDYRLSLFALPFAIAFNPNDFGKFAFYIVFINTILVIAKLPWLRRFQPPGDYSYGIYIYGFVVQQFIAHKFPELTSYPSLLVSIPATCGLAIISWEYIEKPALNYARSLSSAYERYRMPDSLNRV
ncbi:MAG: acyltransferase family protein [Leptothrix sp. (in: b-proteobacteria)]